jgi:hypothetical protein
VKKKIYVLALIVAVVGICKSALWLKSISVAHSVGQHLREDDREEEHEAFDRIVRAMRSYLEDHNGKLPADPYLALVEDRKVQYTGDFMLASGNIIFNWEYVPARIEPNLQRNRKLVLFFANVDGMYSVFYTNGLVERCEELPENPSNLFKTAGYPIWKSLDEKISWLKKEQEKMVWDPSLQMYITREAAVARMDSGAKPSTEQ